MFEKIIIQQNTHWDDGAFKAGFPRVVTNELVKLLDTRQILALIGVRRSGKSTVSKQIINFLIEKKKVNPKNILFLNLEDPFLYSFKEDPNNLNVLFEDYMTLVEPKGRVFVFLDEARFFKDWQVFVKSRYERGGVKFFVTGSNSQLLSREMATLLSGRSIAKNIYPFSFSEIVSLRGLEPKNKIAEHKNQSAVIKTFQEYLRNGGFPEVVLEKNQKIKKEILVNYYKNILYQDIVPRFEVKKTREIEDLLLYLFSNIGQGYSYNSLREHLKAQDKTIKEYIGFFEKSFLLFEISNYQYSLKKQENYPKKAYAVDSGFINAVSFAFSENYGWILENAVFNKLLGRGDKVYYYRGKQECDFVIKRGLKIAEAIQVTKDLNIKNEKREVTGLLEAMEKFKLKMGIIITDSQEEEKKINGRVIKVVPAWKWFLDKK